MTAIDTIACVPPVSSIYPRYTLDVDDDSLQDFVVGHGNAATWYTAILAGAGRGRGIMRCTDGKLRVVYVGTIRKNFSGIYLLDVNIQQNGSEYTVSYRMADSVERYHFDFQGEPEPWVLRPVMCVDDAKNGHQYALVNWQDGYHRNHNTTVMYEMTNGKLVERVSTVGELLNSGTVFDNTFDDGEAVILYGRNAYQFARISTFYRPFAKISTPGIIGGGAIFIEDQFGDGTRDLFTVSQSSTEGITLVNFDLRTMSVNGNGGSQQSACAPLVDGRASLNLASPSGITIEAVNAIGQKRVLVHYAPTPDGTRMVPAKTCINARG